MKVLVTGGAGYIGSHTVLELISAGYDPVILDNFSNSAPAVLKRLEKLSGRPIVNYTGDYQNRDLLDRVFSENQIGAVIHFAASKAVAESVREPLKYYKNNVSGFIELLEAIKKANISNLVFSSSAAVYGEPPTDKVTEETACRPISPYGQSKLMDELILMDFCKAEADLQATSLRYFNVVGAHASGDLGEAALGPPQNALPILIDKFLTHQNFVVFGDDYPTRDGTCERDYIHVVDLAKAHIAALEKNKKAGAGNHIYNIGTGRATSVLELVKTFEKENGVKVDYEIGPRRPGDPAACYAGVDKAKSELGWSATKTIADAVRDAWAWRQKNPQGYN